MGKGIPAALVGAATKNHLLRAVNNLLAASLATNRPALPEPREILATVNAEVFRELAGIGRFVTLVFARFDLRKRLVTLIDCGHTRTVHTRKRGAEYSLLQGENTPLGFSESERYNELTVPFASGDVFFFCTDGVTEARRGGEDFGEQRLAELVCSLNRLEPRELVEKVGAEVLAYSGLKTPKDDVTCVVVKIQDLDRTMAPVKEILEISSELGELPRVRAFLDNLCRKSPDLPPVEEDLAQFQVAVTEVISNIIRHAYHGQADGKIRMEVHLFASRLSMSIYHRGEAFDPSTVAELTEEDLDRLGESHRGLYIIRQSVDKVQYSRTRYGENCVLLMKILKR
jgi:anti-sigma regulatory factor (Ser/Thr protein kinase)